MEIDDDAKKLLHNKYGSPVYIQNWYRCRDVCMAVSAALYMRDTRHPASFDLMMTWIPRTIPNDVISRLPKASSSSPSAAGL